MKSILLIAAKENFYLTSISEWKEYFAKSHIYLFKRLYPGVLEKLGYEKNKNW